MPREVTVACPAKINVGLQVLARRPDGYHEIETLMVPLELCDTLCVERTSRAGIELVVRGAELSAGSDNLVCKALALASGALGDTPHYRAVLEKRIPIAAGLGGGSSDAASALRAVEQLSGRSLGEVRRAALARALGADVPFFLRAVPALATGVGERLRKVVPWPSLACVLVSLPLAVPTPVVYAEVARVLTLPRHPPSIAALLGQPWTALAHGAADAGEGTGPCDPGEAGRVPHALPSRDVQPTPPDVGHSAREPWKRLHPPNDLERVTARRHPEIARLVSELADLGAAVAGMSGSGPTVYGLFYASEVALDAAARLALPAGARTIVTRAQGAAAEEV
jgi:4-diphosphocytidyl-2-C-methyl-D-erythritol kinase